MSGLNGSMPTQKEKHLQAAEFLASSQTFNGAAAKIGKIYEHDKFNELPELLQDKQELALAVALISAQELTVMQQNPQQATRNYTDAEGNARTINYQEKTTSMLNSILDGVMAPQSQLSIGDSVDEKLAATGETRANTHAVANALGEMCLEHIQRSIPQARTRDAGISENVEQTQAILV